MSEEILKALMQLFAIIAKQDEGASENEKEYVLSFLTEQLNEKGVQEYWELFETQLADKKKRSRLQEGEEQESENKDANLTSMGDSVKILGICKKINKTLNQKQKVVVLMRLFELINTDRNFSDQRIMIIDTAAKVFNISKEEYKELESFVVKKELSELAYLSMMIINDGEKEVPPICKSIKSEKLDENLIVLKVSSADIYFLRYTGSDEILLNSKVINNKRIYLFAPGSIIKPSKGKPIFYSDVAAKFLADESFVNLSFEAKEIEFKFPAGNIGLRNVSFNEGSGKLIGIMGASGAGKTTMLNVLSGIETPSKGEVLINGINLHKDNQKVKGIIGYIPQDDLLIEELTVYQNLFYNAKLCFKELKDDEIDTKVINTLGALGLLAAKDLQVGNPLDKKISGGQRKRLNVALELIREPAVLFVDEPTSGLSSRDSENVMELLRELTLKGKLIFVVIHQPSSDIYKMFDNIMFLDVGGYLAYYGNPVEAIMYFKEADQQINSDQGECITCGNVNPESVFNIIESKIVDEYGNASGNRKTEPTEWAKRFEEKRIKEDNQSFTEEPPNLLGIPSKFKQLKIFLTRDVLSKISNKQYLAINFIEAPFLAFLLAFTIRYIEDPEKESYIFNHNQNIYAYVFMSIIVALFIGLTVSAEEIFKDRKILKREKFLNLSKSSYLLSKIAILFSLSAIQAFLFVFVGNWILDIKGMFFEYWLVLFSIGCSANVLGLNISATFNSAVTIYILIPLLIIPQMMLSGAMFTFDKLNKTLGGGDNIPPLVAEIMPSRWAFEAIIVSHFKDNEFDKKFYNFDKVMSICDYKTAYYIPALKEITDKYLLDCKMAKNNEPIKMNPNDLLLIKNEISLELLKGKSKEQVKFEFLDKINPNDFNPEIAMGVDAYFKELTTFYNDVYNKASERKDELIASMTDTEEKQQSYKNLFNQYHNQNITDLVLNKTTKVKVMRNKNNFYQRIDPVYFDPQESSFLGVRTHFFAPQKYFSGSLYDTFTVNIVVIWMFSLVMYIALYFNALTRLSLISKKSQKFLLKFKKKKS